MTKITRMITDKNEIKEIFARIETRNVSMIMKKIKIADKIQQYDLRCIKIQEVDNDIFYIVDCISRNEKKIQLDTIEFMNIKEVENEIKNLTIKIDNIYIEFSY